MALAMLHPSVCGVHCLSSLSTGEKSHYAQIPGAGHRSVRDRWGLADPVREVEFGLLDLIGSCGTNSKNGRELAVNAVTAVTQSGDTCHSRVMGSYCFLV